MSACAWQVAPCYPKETEGFVKELIGLLDVHAMTLDSSLRQTLVKALILMRNRQQVRQAERTAHGGCAAKPCTLRLLSAHACGQRAASKRRSVGSITRRQRSLWHLPGVS